MPRSIEPSSESRHGVPDVKPRSPVDLDKPIIAGQRRAGDQRWLVLGLFIAANLVVSLLGGLATASSVGGWYQTLAKPGFNPPDWVFGPVWSLLYAMIAVAGWLGWRNGASLLPYAMQLGLNLAWSILFFGLRRIDLALVDIAALWLAIAWTLWTYWRSSRLAGGLLLPYLAWVSFAAALNLELWRLN